MKTKPLLLAALLMIGYGCKKEEIVKYYFNCKVNQEKWYAEKYEGFFSDKKVLAAGAYYDPDSQWIQIWGDRSINDSSHGDGYMQGCIVINIAGFEKTGDYYLGEYPTSGTGYSYLLQNWGCSEVAYPGIYYPCSMAAYTTADDNGRCTITKFDADNRIIEGEFSFNATHRGCDLVTSITDGKFSLKYEIKGIGD